MHPESKLGIRGNPDWKKTFELYDRNKKRINMNKFAYNFPQALIEWCKSQIAENCNLFKFRNPTGL